MSKRRNLPLMYAVALLQGMVFYAPIASLYRQAAGLNLTQIALIEGASYLFCLAMELPWGLVADRIGYRRTMIACCGLYFLSKIVFWRAERFGAFLLERLILSAALAGFSGVDQSILCLSCEAGGAHHAFGRYEAFSTLGLLIAAVVYSLCIGENHRLAALLTVISYALALLCALGLREVRPPERRRAPMLRDFCALLRQTLRRRRLLIFLMGFALYREAVQMATVWLNQNQYLRCGMRASAIGWVYLGVNALTLSSALSKRLSDTLGERRLANAGFLACAAACVLLSATRSATLSVACVALTAVSGALLRPLGALIANRAVRVADRATQLSVFALLQDCAAAGGEAIFGRAADVRLSAAFLLCAAACALAWLCCRPYTQAESRELAHL